MVYFLFSLSNYNYETMPISVQWEGYTQSSNWGSNLGYLTIKISETRNKREGENILNIKSAWLPQNPPKEPVTMTDMKLTPRQRPQTPPRLEMKSSQVILWDLSNSEELEMTTFEMTLPHQRQLNLQRKCSPQLCPSHMRCSKPHPVFNHSRWKEAFWN